MRLKTFWPFLAGMLAVVGAIFAFKKFKGNGSR